MTPEATKTSTTDRIEKTIDMKASRARVWKAISDSKQFGTWFELDVDGPFETGREVEGHISSKGKYEGFKFALRVERIEPETYFSYRWHPYAVDRSVDYSKEPMTLVEFRLEDVPGGTRLRITESGFDRIPAARRAEAFRMNDGGWTEQAQRVARFAEGDRIVKTIQLDAPRSRVWKAVSDPREMGAWFGLAIEGSFVPGRTTRARSTGDKAGRIHDMTIETIEPESLFSYLWHPYTVDEGRDYSGEPQTRVEFRLEDSGKGTKLTLTESGFARLPADRSETAFRAHFGGWAFFAGKIALHVSAQ
jgi:uncharacterized protein YndB with AHSA1/START domain